MTLLYFFIIFFILATFLPATRIPHWFFRVPDFIRLQTLIIKGVLLLIFLWFTDEYTTFSTILLIALLICIIYQLFKIIPYTKVFPRIKQPFDSDGMVSILAANVLQDNREYDKFIEEVDKFDPDLVLTMESDKNWENALSAIEDRYTESIKIPMDNYYGMHLYSKVELTHVSKNFEIEDDVPSIYIEYPANGKSIVFACLHPAPPSPTENETSRERDAELMVVGKKIRHLDKSAVVCGDMNDVVWSRTTRLFRKVTGMVDPRVGRGFFSTYHASYPLLRFPLDHLFHTKDLYVGTMKRTKNFGSDHFGMYYEIHYKNNSEVPDNPKLTNGDKKEIEDLIDSPNED